MSPTIRSQLLDPSRGRALDRNSESSRHVRHVVRGTKGPFSGVTDKRQDQNLTRPRRKGLGARVPGRSLRAQALTSGLCDAPSFSQESLRPRPSAQYQQSSQMPRKTAASFSGGWEDAAPDVNYPFCFFIWEAERDRESAHPLAHPQCQQGRGLGAEAHCLSLLCLQRAQHRKLGPGAEPGLEPTLCGEGGGRPPPSVCRRQERHSAWG